MEAEDSVLRLLLSITEHTEADLVQSTNSNVYLK
jgi:hypothetical protein